MPNYIKFQVKSSGQWLNNYGLNAPSGTMACQGELPTTDNFKWEIINSAVAGWYLFQSKDTGQYLNIPGAIPGPGSSNATIACQNPLPNPNNAPDNFLWQIEAPDSNGWSMIKVKSSGQYLNILNGGIVNGTPACQGDTPNTTNFLWMQSQAKDLKNVAPTTVTMNILDCVSMYMQLPNGGPLSEAQANLWLKMEDDKGGAKENPNQNSFETILNPGSQVIWKPKADNSGYTVAITNIIYEQGSGNNVLGPVTPTNGNSGNVTAQVIWTAIRPDSGGDNEAYTIEFTLKKGNDQPKKYTFDPKIRVDPSR